MNFPGLFYHYCPSRANLSVQVYFDVDPTTQNLNVNGVLSMNQYVSAISQPPYVGFFGGPVYNENLIIDFILTNIQHKELEYLL